jgi:hypothetical protein
MKDFCNNRLKVTSTYRAYQIKAIEVKDLEQAASSYIKENCNTKRQDEDEISAIEDAFKAGYKLAHDEAVDGFNEWWLKNFDLMNGTRYAANELWQAAKLSSQKEIARLEARVNELEELLTEQFKIVSQKGMEKNTLKVQNAALKEKLAKAVEYLEKIKNDRTPAWDKMDYQKEARQALEEIKG